MFSKNSTALRKLREKKKKATAKNSSLESELLTKKTKKVRTSKHRRQKRKKTGHLSRHSKTKTSKSPSKSSSSPIDDLPFSLHSAKEVRQLKQSLKEKDRTISVLNKRIDTYAKNVDLFDKKFSKIKQRILNSREQHAALLKTMTQLKKDNDALVHTNEAHEKTIKELKEKLTNAQKAPLSHTSTSKKEWINPPKIKPFSKKPIIAPSPPQKKRSFFMRGLNALHRTIGQSLSRFKRGCEHYVPGFKFTMVYFIDPIAEKIGQWLSWPFRKKRLKSDSTKSLTVQEKSSSSQKKERSISSPLVRFTPKKTPKNETLSGHQPPSLAPKRSNTI